MNLKEIYKIAHELQMLPDYFLENGQIKRDKHLKLDPTFPIIVKPKELEEKIQSFMKINPNVVYFGAKEYYDSVFFGFRIAHLLDEARREYVKQDPKRAYTRVRMFLTPNYDYTLEHMAGEALAKIDPKTAFEEACTKYANGDMGYGARNDGDCINNPRDLRTMKLAGWEALKIGTKKTERYKELPLDEQKLALRMLSLARHCGRKLNITKMEKEAQKMMDALKK